MFVSKKESPGHSAWEDFQSKAVTKNPIFHNLVFNKNKTLRYCSAT